MQVVKLSKMGHMQQGQETTKDSCRRRFTFLLYIWDQYYRIMCREEAVTGIAKTFEDQLIKYQWTMEDRLSEDRQLLGKLLCSNLHLTRRNMYS